MPPKLCGDLRINFVADAVRWPMRKSICISHNGLVLLLLVYPLASRTTEYFRVIGAGFNRSAGACSGFVPIQEAASGRNLPAGL